MSERTFVIDMFAEDRGHEALIPALVKRAAQEADRRIRVRVVSSRGGHGRAIDEFRLYQQGRLRRVPVEPAELIVVAIDTNCSPHSARVGEVMEAVMPSFQHLCIPACPDPHIERWFFADPRAFHQVVGSTPVVPKGKCERDFYKQLLAQAVVDAGHPPTLGGLEFAQDLAEAMDLYRAGRSEGSLRHFIDELRGGLQLLPAQGEG